MSRALTEIQPAAGNAARRAQAGDPAVAYNLGVTLRNRGDPEAEYWLEQAAQAGEVAGLHEGV